MRWEKGEWPMRCRNVLTRIDAMRTGELPQPESAAVHEHLRGCPSCDESVADLEGLTAAVKSLGAEAPKVRVEALHDRFDVVVAVGEPVYVAFTSHGLRMLHAGGSAEEFCETYERRFGRALDRGELTDKLRKQVVAAVTGKGVARPAVDFSDAGEFERAVLETLTRIPRGEVRTYSWVAGQVGRPKAVRAVGNICARNVVPFVVPCHRVVPAVGGVGNYAFGVPMKRELLRSEGVPIDELDELAREGVRFIGSKTTHVFCFPTCRGARRIREANRIPFHDETEASEQGFRPCKHCCPAVA